MVKSVNDNVPSESSVVIPFISTETLQYRIDTLNFGKQDGQRGSLTQVAQKMEPYFTALAKKNTDGSGVIDDDEIERTKSELLRAVEFFDIELTKLIHYSNNLQKQVELNKIAESKREKEIIQVRQQVEESFVLINDARERRSCMMEYESLAKLINENYPNTAEYLQEQIDKVRQEISILKEENIAATNNLNVRAAQFQLLIQYMLDLKRDINEDSEENDVLCEKPKPMEEDDLYADL